jgi:RNA polymerase sigma-70 factor, ECF subfamily
MPYRIVRPRGSLSVVQDSFVDNGQERVAAVYRDQAQRMWRALFSFAGDPDIASDAMAEAFARALRDRGEIRDLAAWTWRVAFRIAASELRRRHTTTASFEDATYELPEAVPELLTALRQLSPNQRVAVILHDYADRPTEEVADVLGCSRATVYVHLSQGRRRLKRFLGDHDD